MASLAVLGVLIYTALPLSGLFDGVRIFGWEPVKRVAVTVDDTALTESRFLFFSTTSQNPVGGWASWNYSGLENKTETPGGCSAPGSDTPCKSGGWPEYRDLVSTMTAIGADPELGCGRAFWEYEKDRVNGYGTPMAPMLLPYWTDGCIGSQEGLYFESSATVPHHFLMQAELSTGPSSPQRGLPYPTFDIDAGVEHLQLLGVRYYLASTPSAIEAAAGHPDLTEVAVSGPWHVYLVADTEMVVPLDHEPVVLDGIDESQHGWLPTAVAWFLDPDVRDVLISHHGSDDWERLEMEPVPDEQRDLVRWIRDQLGERGPMDQLPELPRTELPAIEVRDIEHDRDSISFSVSEPGVPVLVRSSYFPNWVAEGAEGPYRVAPNLMVVVPTDTDVTLNYTRTPVDLVAGAMSVLGLVLLVLLARRPPVDVTPLRPGRLSLLIDGLLSLPDRSDRSDDLDDFGEPVRSEGPVADGSDVLVVDGDGPDDLRPDPGTPRSTGPGHPAGPGRPAGVGDAGGEAEVLILPDDPPAPAPAPEER